MFSFLSPRLWMLIGLGVALLAAFLAGVKVESNRRDAALLAQQQKYQKEVDALRQKERLVQEETAKALDAERNKNQELSARIEQAMKQAESRGGAIQVRARCPGPASRPAVLPVRAETSTTTAASSGPAGAVSGPVASAATENGAASSPSLNSADPQPEASDVTTRVSMDDRIFYASFIGLYNTAITRQPERLPQAAGRVDGGDSAASPVSGRDIIENLDENGKRFADCREKLKAWQNWARKLDLVR